MSEDHLTLFSNLLEDKIIPRSNKFNQRRCGGSLLCTSTHSCLTIERSNDNVPRAKSFRLNRGRITASGNFSAAPKVDVNGSINPAEIAEAEGVIASYDLKQQTSIPKHPKYCCLQQQQYRNCSFKRQQHSALNITNPYKEKSVKVYDCSSKTRLGPNCEDNQGYALSAPEANTDQHQNQRYSIISEQPFKFESGFDEIDILNNTVTPITNNIPHSMISRLWPILKPHQQQHLHAEPKEVYLMLPQPLKSSGVGVFHTKEKALQRIQQQCRLSGNRKANLAALNRSIGRSMNNVIGSAGAAETLATTDRYHVAGGRCHNQDSRNKYNNIYHSCDGNNFGDNMRKMNGSSNTRTLATATVTATTALNKFNDSINNVTVLNMCSKLNNTHAQKSTILSEPNPSNNFFTTDFSLNQKGLINEEDTNMHSHASLPHSSTIITHASARSSVANKPIPVEGGVLSFKQAMSGAVSPQYSITSAMLETGLDISSRDNLQESIATAKAGTGMMATRTQRHSKHDDHSERFVGGVIGAGNKKQRQRLRTSSMPTESRKPRLAETRRAAIHCTDIDLDYYRLRSFSITSHGICNLGDSLRSRRSRSINSVTSTGTSNSGNDRQNSNASRTSREVILEQPNERDPDMIQIPTYTIAMLGASGVGKTTLTYQFTTSDYICAYNLSLDDDYGQKAVSVLIDDIETDLEIIDHPACEMSTEAFCSTYNVDLFVVVYSVGDLSSFKTAEKVLQYLKENEMLLTRGAILVGNKTDLERQRKVNRQMGRQVAKDIACKFIETSTGLVHNVDELLVGIVAQVKLNPQRISNLIDRDRKRLNLQSAVQKHRQIHVPSRVMVRQLSMWQQDNGKDVAEKLMERVKNRPYNNHHMSLFSTGDEDIDERNINTLLSTATTTTSSIKGLVRKTSKGTLNLENILKMGESELEDEDENAGRQRTHLTQHMPPLSRFDLLTSDSSGGGVRTPFGSLNSSPKSLQFYKSGSGGSGCIRKWLNLSSSGNRYHDSISMAEENLLPDRNRRIVMRLANRTKVFLSSVLRFRKAINVNCSSSSSCSDLFVI